MILSVYWLSFVFFSAREVNRNNIVSAGGKGAQECCVLKNLTVWHLCFNSPCFCFVVVFFLCLLGFALGLRFLALLWRLNYAVLLPSPTWSCFSKCNLGKGNLVVASQLCIDMANLPST